MAEQSAEPDARLDIIDAQAAEESQRQGRLTILAERKRTSEFHVFLSYNRQDKDVVRTLADMLLNQGVLPWFDEITSPPAAALPRSSKRPSTRRGPSRW